MKKQFPGHQSLDLSAVNKEVLEEWNGTSLFEQSIKEREGAPSFVFFEDHPRPMACQESTT